MGLIRIDQHWDEYHDFDQQKILHLRAVNFLFCALYISHGHFCYGQSTGILDPKSYIIFSRFIIGHLAQNIHVPYTHRVCLPHISLEWGRGAEPWHLKRYRVPASKCLPRATIWLLGWQVGPSLGRGGPGQNLRRNKPSQRIDRIALLYQL